MNFIEHLPSIRYFPTFCVENYELGGHVCQSDQFIDTQIRSGARNQRPVASRNEKNRAIRHVQNQNHHKTQSGMRIKSKSGGGRRNSNVYLRASRRESPYEVLGVSPSATPNEIKRAYRRLALKYHPDVNKEATAQQKFMRIKHAYNTLLNSESRGRYDYGDRSSEYSYYSTQRNQGHNRQEEEEFYGFGNFLKDVQITIGDLFKDIQEEFQNWEAGVSSQGKPKSLWEELAEIGEEFVEFIEKELNISEPETETDNNDEWPQRGHPFESSGPEKHQADKESCIEENIDEIEATLAQLKKELGL